MTSKIASASASVRSHDEDFAASEHADDREGGRSGREAPRELEAPQGETGRVRECLGALHRTQATGMR